MKLKLFCCFCLLVGVSQFASAQDPKDASANLTTSADEKPFVAPPEPPPPLFILNVDGITVEIDPDVNKTPVENLLNSDAINSIEFMTGDEGLMRYGHKGRNGVIIVNFKEYSVLPPGLQVKDGDGE